MNAYRSAVSLLILFAIGTTSVGFAQMRPSPQTSLQAGAYIVLFDRTTYRGNPRNFSTATSDVGTIGDRRVRSVTIGSGVWDVCENPNFRGRCVTLRRSTPDLGALNLRTVRSVRPTVATSTPRDWYIVVYDRTNYRGGPRNFRNATAVIGSNQAVRSVTIGKGVWEICDGLRFTGHCVTLDTSIPDLRVNGFSGPVHSLRPVRPELQPR